MLALATGLVAAFFSVFYQAVEEFFSLAPHEQFKELMVIGITSIGMLLAIEPILERISPVRFREHSAREDDLLIRAGALLTIVATALLHGLLHAHISQSLSVHGMLVIEQLLTALVAPTLITLAWIYGVAREQYHARWYGLVAGMLAGVSLVLIATVQLYFFRPSTGLREAAGGNAAIAMLGVATSFVWFVIPTCAVNGYLGGLALDRQWTGKAWRAVAIGLMLAAAVEAGSFMLTSSFEFQALKTVGLTQPDSIGSLIAEAVVGNLGWAMGLLVRPDADALLGSAVRFATRSGRSTKVVWALTSATAMLALATLMSISAIALRGHIAGLLLGQAR